MNSLSTSFLATRFKIPVEKIEKLFGEASYREYYRIFSGYQQSYILMKLPAGIESASEEVSNDGLVATELPFVNVARYLSGQGIPVPQVIDMDLDQGLVLLQDLGDQSFEKLIQNSSSTLRLFFYQQAIDLLLTWQSKTTRNPDSECIAFQRSFDERLLTWEFEHFLEYGIEDRFQCKIPQAERDTLMDYGKRLAYDIAKLPQVLCHRDFQSRNLMLFGYELYAIDFQDALMGPLPYDLVALLRDSYISLAAEEIETLLGYYVKNRTQHSLSKIDLETFRHDFYLVSLQRKLKDTGRFQYIDTVKGNPKFLVHVPDSLKYVRQAFEHLPEFQDLLPLLAKFVPELR